MKIDVTYTIHVPHWLESCPVVTIARQDFLNGNKEDFGAVVRMLTAMGGCYSLVDDTSYMILHDYLEKNTDQKLILGIREAGADRKLVIGTTRDGKLYPIFKNQA